MANPPRPDFRIFLRAASLLTSSLHVDAVLRELLDGLDLGVLHLDHVAYLE